MHNKKRQLLQQSCSVFFILLLLLLVSCGKTTDTEDAIIVKEEKPDIIIEEPAVEETTPLEKEEEIIRQPVKNKLEAGKSKRITRDTTNPEVFGNKIIWHKRVYDIERDLSYTVETSHSYAIYKDKIAFSGFDGLYVLDLNTQEQERVDDTAGYSNFIDFDGNHIVWSEGIKVYLKDLETGEKKKLAENGLKPRIQGNYTVWYDFRFNKGAFDKGHIYAYDIKNEKEMRITEEFRPEKEIVLDVYGPYVVFSKRTGSILKIAAANIETGEEKILSTGTKNQLHPSIYENLVIWQDYRTDEQSSDYETPTQIYVHDLESGLEKKTTTGGTAKINPVIHNNHIAWVQRDGIHFITLT